jgi:hypothetical protein
MELILLRDCETRCSTKISRGVGVLMAPMPSAEALMWYRRAVL